MRTRLYSVYTTPVTCGGVVAIKKLMCDPRTESVLQTDRSPPPPPILALREVTGTPKLARCPLDVVFVVFALVWDEAAFPRSDDGHKNNKLQTGSLTGIHPRPRPRPRARATNPGAAST